MDNRLRNLIDRHQARLKNSNEHALFYKNKNNEKLAIMYGERAREEEIILEGLNTLKEKKMKEVKVDGTRSM